MFGNLGFSEMVVIFVFALIVFGPRRLPEIARSVARTLGQLRSAASELKETVEREVDAEQIRSSVREVRGAAEQAAAPMLTAIDPATMDFPEMRRRTPADEAATGEPAAGEPAAGEPPSGEPAAGEPPSGEPSSGEPPSGEPPSGEPPSGEPPSGEPSSAEPPAAEPPAGEPPSSTPSTSASASSAPPTTTPPMTGAIPRSSPAPRPLGADERGAD